MNRRKSLTKLASLTAIPFLSNFVMNQSLLQRSIPSTGEKLPAVGVGTWQTFNVGTGDAERKPLKDVLQKMIEAGAKVIDSSPMYGNSEGVVGDLSTEAGVNDKLFIATKVWTSGEQEGIRQMNRSFELLKRKKMDLMQVHNLVDWQTHLKTLRKWKDEGKVRYIGITHYTDGSHSTLANIIKNNPIDFVQVNYNLMDWNAEKELLPAAIERKVAIIANRPFEEGALFQRTKGKELPAWAAEFDCKSWGQFFLKFILSHPAVTCAIPGTSKVTHLMDNLGAAMGKLPDEKQREKMKSAI
ncbi:MAG TPA: aldo/keto reductase [Cyclobacteriaceae bacterium]|nr:aldo/keto reductase [Cyclobacteriaceae bacterium]